MFKSFQKITARFIVLVFESSVLSEPGFSFLLIHNALKNGSSSQGPILPPPPVSFSRLGPFNMTFSFNFQIPMKKTRSLIGQSGASFTNAVRVPLILLTISQCS